jgi:Flp pilus assembly protein TadD
LYIRSGKPADALALINKDPTSVNSTDLLGVKAAAQVALQQKDEACDTYGQILKLDPDHAIALNNLAFSLAVRKNNPQEALPLAEKAYRQAGGRTTRSAPLPQEWRFRSDCGKSPSPAHSASPRQIQRKRTDAFRE